MENQTPAPAAATAAPRSPRKTGKKSTKPATKVAAKSDGKIALKTICAKLKIEPKAARRKLRKSGLSFHEARDRWTFTSAQAERVTEILKA
jgi:hypothetical protein